MLSFAIAFKILKITNASTTTGPLVINQRKEWATVGPYGPNILGYTPPTMVETMRCNTER